jgi:hypothetical protein
MTSLIAWIGANKGLNSVYLASDSRISWDVPSRLIVWDSGRKLFASRHYPEILGYCGDVLFPSQVLSQIVEHIDAGLFFSVDDTPEMKSERIFSSIRNSFSNYPILQSQVSVIYCTRQNILRQPIVYGWRISWKSGKWDMSPLNFPLKSGLVLAMGSGGKMIEKFYEKWNRSEISNTSRNVFSAFCDALKSAEDPKSGGAPQVVGFYREGSAKSFGVVFENERYLFGLPVHPDAEWDQIEWRNELFERCNAESKSVLKDAQRHARPSNL